MVKHGSGHLRNALIYSSFTLLGRYPVLYDYYKKKRDEADNLKTSADSHETVKPLKTSHHDMGLMPDFAALA